MNDDADDFESEHQAALEETGFWGRRGAGCIVYSRSTGRILLPLRSQGVLEPGTWGVWGGAVDEELTFEQSALKELIEETGFDGDVELTFIVDFRASESEFVYRNFLAVVEEEFTPILNWETERAEWFECEALPSPLHYGLEYIVGQLPTYFADLKQVIGPAPSFR